jgi:hypothetical protein
MPEGRVAGIIGSLLAFVWAAAVSAKAQGEPQAFPEPLVEPLRPPFLDDFDPPTVDPARWTRMLGVQTGLGPAQNEPGLRLDGAGLAPPRSAELWSAPINLELGGPVRVGVIAAPSSARTTAPLLIEYRSAGGGWHELRRVPPGAAMPPGGLIIETLPADGLHRSARLRLRVELGAGLDGWTLHEVAIVPARHSLALAFQPDGNVAVSVEPADVLGRGGGDGSLIRFFEGATTATLSAPARTSRWVFERWEIGGRAYPDGQNVVTRLVDRDLAALAEYAVLGDMNGDGVVDRYDLDAFVLATVDPEGYADRYPDLDRLRRGDMNGDGVIDELDIEPFVERLLSP